MSIINLRLFQNEISVIVKSLEEGRILQNCGKQKG